LEGKIALISGGTTGMGAAIAKRFQTEGATMIATGANPETLEKAKKEPWASKSTSFFFHRNEKKYSIRAIRRQDPRAETAAKAHS
jgi:NADP-dependent 3-hydroxy acid dehydrogenase YdfG